jgi:hypothetical protein
MKVQLRDRLRDFLDRSSRARRLDYHYETTLTRVAVFLHAWRLGADN